MLDVDGVSLQDIYKILPSLNTQEREHLLSQLGALEKLKNRKVAQEKFLGFVKAMWPSFISGKHHAVVAEAFERVAAGTCKRLIICMPPRHTKSEFASYLLPAWFLGKHPGKQVIQASNTAELAQKFGRKVRNLVDSDVYHEAFPEIALSADSQAAGRWNTNKDGSYFAIGVGGTMTGRGADLMIIDDPHSESEAVVAENNPEVYDKVYEWYTSGPRQRLQPNGAVVIVMCMTGETPVLMADGSQKRLSEVKVGDLVATFDEGRLTTTVVNNWRSSGIDTVYKIQTRSGKVLRANERHPFLVLDNGVLTWTRLNQLRLGDELVSLKAAAALLGQKLNRVNADLALQATVTIENTQTPLTENPGSMGNGKDKGAQKKTVIGQLQAGVCALGTTISGIFRKNHRKWHANIELNQGTASLWNSLRRWSPLGKTGVTYVNNPPLTITSGLTGTENFVSTTATQPGKSEDCSAMIATLQSDMARHQMFSNELRRISDFTIDPIISITPDGIAEVYDVEIDRTENFIANGIVSHNTRWSKRDLVGQVLKAAANRGGDDWEVIEFPAMFDGDRPLWPQFWSKEAMMALREELSAAKWMAQYQQNPTAEGSAIVKREWWKLWDKPEPPKCEFTLTSWDTAFEKNNRADYSACTTWGVFFNEETDAYNVILLNAFKQRMEFPELKRRALENYNEWEPDSLIVEKKASGAPLIYELRAMGIPVQEYTPSKGQDKIARLNAVASLFESGVVWAPDTHWAEEVIEEVASFPAGDHDDLVDSTTVALMRFRQGGFMRLPTDEKDPIKNFRRREGGYY